MQKKKRSIILKVGEREGELLLGRLPLLPLKHQPQHRPWSSFLFSSLFSHSLFFFQNVTFSPSLPFCISSTPAPPPMASLSLPRSSPHQAPLSPPLSFSSVFSHPLLLLLLPPLHTIQLYNHIIKQHYCICNYV